MPAFVLPVQKVTKPSCLKGQENGKLAAGILKKCDVGSALMADPAARAMRAMVAAMRAALNLDYTHVGAYRTYKGQENLFLSRYTTTPLPGRPTKTWNGVKYWQKPGTAMAAVPGTSNHGWGLAIDLAERVNGKAVSISPRSVKWLIKHAAQYGFCAEAQSEPWHWRYFTGDKIPAAVLAFEGATTAPVAPVAPSEKTHTIVKGDTWWKLATKYLGAGKRYPELQALNPNVSTLVPGRKVRVG
jgi:nucleoid-associated protein YgaU